MIFPIFPVLPTDLIICVVQMKWRKLLNSKLRTLLSLGFSVLFVFALVEHILSEEICPDLVHRSLLF